MSRLGNAAAAISHAGAGETPTAPAAGELHSTRGAGVLLAIYGWLRGAGAARGRRAILRLLVRLESGEMRSATLREIMRRFHGVEIGAHSYGCFDATRFPRGTRIGRYVSVGPGVAVYRRNHPLERLSLHPCFYNAQHGAAPGADVATATLDVGADAWLGARAMVLPGCRRIGRGAVVAAGAVVTRDVPDYAVVAGNPARVIRYRFEPEAMDAAERSGWWLDSPDAVVRRFDMVSPWACPAVTPAQEDQP
jgi:acetyltransferase-like isoleucine patch superfamily enzyme